MNRLQRVLPNSSTFLFLCIQKIQQNYYYFISEIFIFAYSPHDKNYKYLSDGFFILQLKREKQNLAEFPDNLVLANVIRILPEGSYLNNTYDIKYAPVNFIQKYTCTE